MLGQISELGWWTPNANWMSEAKNEHNFFKITSTFISYLDNTRIVPVHCYGQQNIYIKYTFDSTKYLYKIHIWSRILVKISHKKYRCSWNAECIKLRQDRNL
jgi:hypothetical protein